MAALADMLAAVRSVTKPIAQGALLFTTSFFGLLWLESMFEARQRSAEHLNTADLVLRSLMIPFSVLLLSFLVVNALRWAGRRLRSEPLPGLGAGVVYAAVSLALALPFALGSGCRSFDQRVALDGKVYFLSMVVAWDNDGTFWIYECDAFSLGCIAQRSLPFTPHWDMFEQVRLVAEPAQHHVAVTYRGEPLFGYSPSAEH